MSFESVIEFFIQHNVALTEGLIAAVLVISIYLGFRSLRASPDQSAGSSSNLSEIEETLKKLLEKAALVPSAGTPGAGLIANAEGGAAPGGVSPELLGEIETLKKSLTDKQAEIEALKAQPGAGAGSGLSDEEKAKLEAQLKDLQSKLAEYEIISEDIADLSFYKEENAKLLKQLEAKGAAAPAAAPAPAAAAPPAPEVADTTSQVIPTPAAPEAPPVAAPAVAEAAPSTPAPVEPAPAAPPVEEPPKGVDEDLMAEFEQAVVQQGGSMAPAPKAPVEAAPATPAVEPAPEAPADEQNLGSLDLDKMMDEAKDIQAPVDAAAVNALESTIDETKLLAEATELDNVKPEDKNLMDEFENFVKKGT